MTADDARRLTEQSIAPDPEVVRAILSTWYLAIEVAAKDGQRFVRESKCVRLRMPVRTCEKAAAIEQLRRDGFAAKHEEVGPNETEMTVSWRI